MTSKQNFNKGFTPLEVGRQKASAGAARARLLTGFTPINKLLKSTAKEYHLENALYRHKTLQSWHKVISGFIEEAQSQTQAVDFQKGVLTVACLSREAAYKIRLMAERIIAALNEVLGRRVVYAIYVEM